MSVSEETRRKMSEAAKRRGSNSKGKKFSDEARARISEAQKARRAAGATFSRLCLGCNLPFQSTGTKTLFCDHVTCQKLKKLRRRLKPYDLTREQYETRLHEQNHACKICLERFSEQLQDVVDHDHVTGQVRSILCIKCNAAIGWLETRSRAIDGWLKRAVDYLRLE